MWSQAFLLRCRNSPLVIRTLAFCVFLSDFQPSRGWRRHRYPGFRQWRFRPTSQWAAPLLVLAPPWAKRGVPAGYLLPGLLALSVDVGDFVVVYLGFGFRASDFGFPAEQSEADVSDLQPSRGWRRHRYPGFPPLLFELRRAGQDCCGRPGLI